MDRVKGGFIFLKYCYLMIFWNVGNFVRNPSICCRTIIKSDTELFSLIKKHECIYHLDMFKKEALNLKIYGFQILKSFRIVNCVNFSTNCTKLHIIILALLFLMSFNHLSNWNCSFTSVLSDLLIYKYK